MKLLKYAFILLPLAFALQSCGEADSESWQDLETRSFEAWMNKYINNGVGPNDSVATRLSNGGYIQKLYSDPALPVERPQWGQYVELNYRGMMLSDWDHVTERGSMFMTRYKADAERMGTYTHYTNYIPQLIQFSRNNAIMQGMLDAITYGDTMRVGDVVRLYLPTAQAANYSGLTFTSGSGFDGIVSQPASAPVIIEVELAGIVNQPQRKEEKFVQDYAAMKWGQTDADTVRQFLFMDIIEPGPDDKAVIAADSSVYIEYEVWLAYNDFLVDTNIKETADGKHRTPTTYTSSYKPSNAPSSPAVVSLDALSEVLGSERVTYGSTVEFITTSLYGFGANGQAGASGTTEVLPYQPLRYVVKIAEYEEPATDDDDE